LLGFDIESARISRLHISVIRKARSELRRAPGSSLLRVLVLLPGRFVAPRIPTIVETRAALVGEIVESGPALFGARKVGG